MIQARFINIECARTLKIYKVDVDLKHFMTTLRDMKYGTFRLPEPKFRLHDEEYPGTNDTDGPKVNFSDEDSGKESQYWREDDM
jgi:hypothetical protein